ncbi:MAG: thiamine biosynthesis protein ThiS [Acidobacteria bacterium RBG_16_68_9]|nr:MAG: thiamine biosynthesis protein ThiS [Acidobacteria bacterium RBG_16_68_9]
MRVTLNGEPQNLRDHLTVAELVRDLGLNQSRIAVEVNRDVLPRDQYAQHRLCEGDLVEVVHFIGGG